jgi:hypothetical protein
MKVRVRSDISETLIGFFEHIRRRPGDTFSIPDAPRRLPFPGEQRAIERGGEEAETYAAIKDKDGKIPAAFSFKWMEPASANTPERITTAQQAMDKASEIIKQEKAAARMLDQGDAKPQSQTADVI